MTTKADILRSIRRNCLDCSCGQPGEVRTCRITSCALWPFRFGQDPEPSAKRGFAKQAVYTRDSAHGPVPGTLPPPRAGNLQNLPATRAVFAGEVPSLPDAGG